MRSVRRVVWELRWSVVVAAMRLVIHQRSGYENRWEGVPGGCCVRHGRVPLEFNMGREVKENIGAMMDAEELKTPWNRRGTTGFLG